MNVLELTHRSSICILSHCCYYFYLNMMHPIGNYHVLNGIKQELRFSVMRITLRMRKNILLISSARRCQMNNVRHAVRTQVATRNGFVHPRKRTQKPTEGTGTRITHGVKGAKSNYFRRNQMAQVTYRGVKYDSKEYNAKVLAEQLKTASRSNVSCQSY